jgi:hypothetical protein
MAKESESRARSATHRDRNPGDRPAWEWSDSPDFDMERAVAAGDRAEQELKAAEQAMSAIAGAAEAAQGSIYRALRAAEYAEEAAGRLLDDARRMMHSARVRTEKVRALFRGDEGIVDSFNEGQRAVDQAEQVQMRGQRAIDQAEQGRMRAMQISVQAANQALRAASQAQSRRDWDQSDQGCN